MIDLKVPALGESITEAIVGRWLKHVGEHVEADEPVVDLETDKITMQIPAPSSGALTEQKFAEGDTVRVGDVVGLIDELQKGQSSTVEAAQKGGLGEGAGVVVVADPMTAVPQAPAAAESTKPMMTRVAQLPERGSDGRRLSPSERREFREKGAPAVAAPVQPAASPAPVVAGAGATGLREQVKPMSPLRKRIAERLVQAQHETASLTTFNEVDMSGVMELRSRYKSEFIERFGVKLGFMSFFVKAAQAALELFPGVNAEVREDAIVYKKYYDIGIAVGTPKGLIVPVLRGVDSLGFADIEKGIIDLATRARDAKLTLDDLTGATFTITNGGIYGSMMSTPLLNYPQTGILGMHNIAPRAVVVDGSVEVRPMMYIALTYDHRVVDGKEAVSFLVALKERIEAPERLMFGV